VPTAMTSKQRTVAVLKGRAVDRMPVAALYDFLYHLDHFAELTGRPQWQMHRWLHDDPEDHVATAGEILGKVPFDAYQPQYCPTRQVRENTEFFERNGRVFRRYGGQVHEVAAAAAGGHATDYHANETQYVFDESDADERIVATPAERQIAAGLNDYLEATVAALGGEQFIISGGVVGTLYSCGQYVGQTNALAMLIERPHLIDYVCKKIVEQNVETIRRLAAAGGDAIYIDDATATCDMISVAHYERFSLPYMQQMVREIHCLGHQAILIYFGGVADRLEQIAAIGADAVSVETSMKGYVNDIGAIAETIGGRVSLFANIDPVGVLQDGSDEDLAAEIGRQVAAGRKARGFVISPASPITPATPLARVQRFIELSRQLGQTA